MNTLMKTGSLAAAGILTTALVAWQAPALADHGADDGTQVSAHHRGDHHRADDGPGHDRGDDHGRHHGGRHHGHGADDGPGHDRGDDHGGDRGSRVSASR